MRINCTDDEDRPGQFALWQANCHRSMRGRAGQMALRELEAALVALPQKRLARNVVACQGDVCAVGALLVKRKVDAGMSPEEAIAALETELGDEEDQYYVETDELGVEAGMPRLVAWKLVFLNDEELDTVWEVALGPRRPWDATYQGGIPYVREMTPEERYERVLAWVRKAIVEPR